MELDWLSVLFLVFGELCCNRKFQGIKDDREFRQPYLERRGCLLLESIDLCAFQVAEVGILVNVEQEILLRVEPSQMGPELFLLLPYTIGHAEHVHSFRGIQDQVGSVASNIDVAQETVLVLVAPLATSVRIPIFFLQLHYAYNRDVVIDDLVNLALDLENLRRMLVLTHSGQCINVFPI